MKYIIITGAGSGLGKAMAELVIDEQYKVFCISRSMNYDLKERASQNKTFFLYYEQDLGNTGDIPSLIDEIFTYIDPTIVSEITLINNAGIIEPVKSMGNCTVDEITRHVEVNLTAPLVLTNEFISKSTRFHCKKNIVNISSGAAHNPYAGWTLYCSTKAGLDMSTRTISLEQSTLDFPVRILSIAPGILDTGMQERLRNVHIDNFPMKPKFEKLYEQQRLTDPVTAARRILDLVNDDSILNGSHTDLRNIKSTDQ